MKKTIILFLVLMGLSVSKSLAFEADTEFEESLEWMHSEGLTQYDNVNDFMPAANLTREQAAHFFVNFASEEHNVELSEQTPEYEDMDSVDPTLEESVVEAFQMWIMQWHDWMFRPKDYITRAEFFTVAVRLIDGEKSQDYNPWWQEYFEMARQLDLTNEEDVNAQDRNIMRYEAGLVLARAAWATEQDEYTEPDEYVDYQVEELWVNLDEPWWIDFLPNNWNILITEKSWNLILVDAWEYEANEISQIPEVNAAGQWWLLDVAIHPEYPDDLWVYLTYSADAEGWTTTVLGRGELDTQNYQLTNFEELFEAETPQDSTVHYGSRVMFDNNWYVYLTVGDRGDKNFDETHNSQTLTNHLGTTIRLNSDWTVPEDNPFVDEEDVLDEIYTYGHRNVQGMSIHPDTWEIWQSEHWEQDGDEINIIYEWADYGWPITHYGCTYGTGEPIWQQPDQHPDIIDPVYYRECNTWGFPPAGMTFVSSDVFPQWQWDLFVWNLAWRYLGYFEVDDDNNVEEKDPLLEERWDRIRDVGEHPQTGFLYVLVDDTNTPLLRITPQD